MTPVFQAGWMTAIFSGGWWNFWKVLLFLAALRLLQVHIGHCSDQLWVILHYFIVSLRGRNVQDVTVVQTKRIKVKKIPLPVDLTLMKNCCMVLLYNLRCFRRIFNPKNPFYACKISTFLCVYLIAPICGCRITHLSWQWSWELLETENKQLSFFSFI